MGEINGCHLVTIEGLTTGDELTPFQQSFYSEGASQCGFCTPGMIMSLTGNLLGTERPSSSTAMESLDGNICRCTGYVAVKRAVDNVMNRFSLKPGQRIESLIEDGHIPPYFSTVEERLKQLPSATSETGSAVVAGGTDIYVHSSEMLSAVNPEFLTQRDDLKFIRKSNGTVEIGAAVTLKQLRESQILAEILPGLKDFLLKVSSTQIRSRATVGGNIVNASPIADMAVILLALDAAVAVSERSIPLHRFYLGYKKLDMSSGEILTAVSFPVPDSGSVLSSLKVSKREFLDIASVNSSMLFTVEKGVLGSVRLSAGGVAPVPLLLEKTGAFLSGKTISEETINTACAIAVDEIAPISDIRGSSEYKTQLLKAQIRAHITRGPNR
jgi:xanthine dehydrogenase small subunit